MIEFLIAVIVLLVVIYVVKLVVAEIPLPENIKTVVWLILGLIILFAVLNFFGLTGGSLGRFPCR